MKTTNNKKYIGGKISIEELFVLYRRRFHLTQGELGKMFGVAASAISQWEKPDDKRNSKFRRNDEIAAKEFLLFHYEQNILDGLTENEVCFLLRTRAKVFQKQIADQRGTCRIWQHRIESGLEPLCTHALFLFMIKNYGEDNYE